jgi:hypothetical protein
VLDPLDVEMHVDDTAGLALRSLCTVCVWGGGGGGGGEDDAHVGGLLA